VNKNYELRNVSEKKQKSQASFSSGLQTGPLLDGREGSARGLSCVIHIILILQIILLFLLLVLGREAVLIGGHTSAQPLLVRKIHSLLFNAGKESNFFVCNSAR
jgi:hypothetical protein